MKFKYFRIKCILELNIFSTLKMILKFGVRDYYIDVNLSDHHCLTLSHQCLTLSHQCLTLSHQCLTLSHQCLTLSHQRLTLSHQCLTLSHQCLTLSLMVYLKTRIRPPPPLNPMFDDQI